jgi:hypothetical protein
MRPDSGQARRHVADQLDDVCSNRPVLAGAGGDGITGTADIRAPNGPA